MAKDESSISKASQPAKSTPSQKPSQKKAPAKGDPKAQGDPKTKGDPKAKGDRKAKASGNESEAAPARSFPRRLIAHLGGACTISMALHVILIVVLAFIAIPELSNANMNLLSELFEQVPEDELVEVELEKPTDPATEITPHVVSSAPTPGAEGAGGGAGDAPSLDNTVVSKLDKSPIRVDSPTVSLPSSKLLIEGTPKGTLGDPREIVDSYKTAMDRITQEIMWMLDNGPTLVIWCFDQSDSMKDDQKEIRDRIDRVYKELGLADVSEGNHLLTSVCSFGGRFGVHTRKPTSNIDQIRAAIDAVPNDRTGLELMCPAIQNALNRHQKYARKRQMALIVVSDESGHQRSNTQMIEDTIGMARKIGCRTYILGRESVFGYPYAYMRWVHPQTRHTHWLQVDRGPETAFVEQLQTDGFRRRYDAFGSGFGPYFQCRLARETGGIFFMLPSTESNIVWNDKRKYELEAMRAFKPDLRPMVKQLADRKKYPLRALIWKVIYDLNPYDPANKGVIEMRWHWSPKPPEFLRQLVQARNNAVKHMRYMGAAQKALEEGLTLREQEASPRWQANYDLIYAQLIAYQARMYEYGAFLEHFAKNPRVVPLKVGDKQLVHWTVRTINRVLTEESKPYIQKSKKLLLAVKKNYPGTPWAGRADWELKRGFGVDLVPHYRKPYVPGPGVKLIPVPKY